MTRLPTIELVHVGGERVTVQVTDFSPGEFIYFRWKFCTGEYKLQLRTGHVIFNRRSPTWRAADLAKCWELWNNAKGLTGVHRRMYSKVQKG